MQIIFLTFIETMSSLLNVGALMALIIYIYAVLGINLFADIKFNEPMHDRFNFLDVWNAFITLFATATGEGWDGLMVALSKDKSAINDCIVNPTYDDYVKAGYKPVGCGNTLTSYVFFFTFILLVTMVFLNLFVAIILNGYFDTKEK
jgi:hypothetical protein